MTKTQFRLGVGALFAAILLFNLTSPDRYSLIGGNTSLTYKIFDGVTGNLYLFRDGEWINIKDLAKKSKAAKPNE